MASEKIDFLKIFRERLEFADPLDSMHAQNIFLDAGDWEIREMAKGMPAFLLVIGTSSNFNYEIWIDDYRNYNSELLFREIFKKLREILIKANIHYFLVLESLLVQDEEGNNILVTGKILLSKGDFFYSKNKLQELKERYGLSEIEWRSPHAEEVKDDKLHIHVSADEVDAVGRIEENMFLLGIAERFGMDEDQFVTFKNKINALKRQGISRGINYEVQANQVIHYDDMSSIVG